MKTLYFLRHANSDSIVGVKDIDRPLNKIGHRVAPKMGRELFKMDEIPNAVFCSSAERTRETASYVCEGLKIDESTVKFDDEIYEASTRTLLKVINEFSDDLDSIMLIGHNPSISYLLEYLTDEIIGNVPPCGIVKIIFSMDSWSEVSKSTGMLKWTVYPEQFGYE